MHCENNVRSANQGSLSGLTFARPWNWFVLLVVKYKWEYVPEQQHPPGNPRYRKQHEGRHPWTHRNLPIPMVGNADVLAQLHGTSKSRSRAVNAQQAFWWFCSAQWMSMNEASLPSAQWMVQIQERAMPGWLFCLRIAMIGIYLAVIRKIFSRANFLSLPLPPPPNSCPNSSKVWVLLYFSNFYFCSLLITSRAIM